jgi:hypothetical protein
MIFVPAFGPRVSASVASPLPLRPEGLAGTWSVLFSSWRKDGYPGHPQGPAVERAKAQIAEYRRFRNLVRELIVVSEQICPAQARDLEDAPASQAKKNLFADLLASDVVPEIEKLLGRRAVEELDLEALELAVRQQVLQLVGAAVEATSQCRHQR